MIHGESELPNSRARMTALWAGIDLQKNQRQPTKLLNLPGFRRFEDRVLAGDPRWPWHEASDRLSSDTFDVTYNETLYLDGYEPDQKEWGFEAYGSFLQGRKDHELRFELSKAAYDEDRVAILLRLGIDFRNEAGQPLRCTKAFCRQAEFAIRFRGWKPEKFLKRDDVWGGKLEAEAQKWMRNRRS